MKLSKMFLLLVALVFVACVGIVVAEDATVSPYTFTVPDGYTIVTSDDTTCAMQKDDSVFPKIINNVKTYEIYQNGRCQIPEEIFV